MSQPIVRITTNPITMHSNSAEAMKKRLVSGRLLSLSATYFQGSAMVQLVTDVDDACMVKWF